MNRIFKLKESGTSVRTEIVAGLTTFMTMAYILVVNPMILSDSGMDWGKVFTATALSSAVACLVMAFAANLPYALAPGMGLNAFFSYTVCIGMGYSYRFALTAIFVEGIIFIILTLTNLREAIVNCFPKNLKKAISAGIGLFIAYIGLKNAGIIVSDASNITALSPDWMTGGAAVALIGVIITGVLLAFRVKGALLIGMIASTLIGIPFGVTTWSGGSFIPSAPYFFDFSFAEAFGGSKAVFDFMIIVLTFLFLDMFDTIGTLIACAEKTQMINEDGTIPRCKQALFSDAIGTTVGGVFGTSTVTTFVESSAGVAAGGRTGLTALVVGIMFIVSLFLSPVFGCIPSAATAPALMIVGVMMLSPIKEIDYDDYTESVPAFMTIVIMMASSSISDGIMFGTLTYVLLKLLSGKVKEIKPAMYVLAALFIVKIVISRL